MADPFILLVGATNGPFMPNDFQIIHLVFDMKIKFFLLVAMATRNMHGIKILNNSKDYPRIIPVKFGEIIPSTCSLGEFK